MNTIHKTNNVENELTGDINKQLSYSLIMEKKNNIDPLSTTLPKIVHKWVDDASVIKCLNCKKIFSIWLRKHHCRLCGKIFCNECSKYRQKVPTDLLSNESINPTWNDFLSSSDYELKRLCVTCNILVDRINQVKKIVEVFHVLNFDIIKLNKAAEKCKLWNFAANYLLSKFKNVQYRLPNYNFRINGKLEKKLLWTNRYLINGHSKYLLTSLKCCETVTEIEEIIDIMNNRKKYKSMKCIDLMCTRNCSKKLNARDAFNLLAYIFRFPNDDKNCDILLKKIALKYFNCSDKEFSIYIPFFVYHLKNDDDLLADYLINRCKSDILLSSLFNELNLYLQDFNDPNQNYKKIMNKLTLNFSHDKEKQQKFIKLIKGKAFTDIIKNAAENINESINDDELEDKNQAREIQSTNKFDTTIHKSTNKFDVKEIEKKYILKEDLNYPLDLTKKIRKIILKDTKFKISMSKPIIIPCETDKGEIVKLMYKRDNLRNDQIIMKLIELVQIIIKEEENIDLNIVTYNVLPLTQKSGIIQIVQDAETIYVIKLKLKNTILNYMINKMPNVTIGEFKERYIKSAAAYGVITYLFGIGDRHLDNIMMTRDGRMFHVDFGYILGRDPTKIFEPGIRITDDMIDAMGGFSSDYYRQFTELSSKIYNCLRRNINVFMNMLLLIPELYETDFTVDEICNQIISRFKPGENELEASFHLKKKIEEQRCTDRIKDWFHYHSKEQTVNSAVSNLDYAWKTFSDYWYKK